MANRAFSPSITSKSLCRYPSERVVLSWRRMQLCDRKTFAQSGFHLCGILWKPCFFRPTLDFLYASFRNVFILYSCSLYILNPSSLLLNENGGGLDLAKCFALCLRGVSTSSSVSAPESAFSGSWPQPHFGCSVFVLEHHSQNERQPSYLEPGDLKQTLFCAS